MERVNLLPGFDRGADYAAAREVLARAGYTEEGVAELLGRPGVLSFTAEDLPGLLERTAAGTPLCTLARLFLLGEAEPADRVAAALAPMDVAGWVAAGLLEEISGGGVLSRVLLQPFAGDVYAIDRRRRRDEEAAPDVVMGIGSPSKLLSRLTVRREVGRGLDLGCGCGVHAIQASRHCQEVVGVDQNPRAVQFSRFNAALNGRTNVTFYEGDLYQPVKGQTFDLIVSNPPFVLSPERRVIFLDSGRRGDDLLREILQEAAAVLNQQGVCQVLGNWVRREGEASSGQVFEWLDKTGTDVWVVCGQEILIADYPAVWQHQYGASAPSEEAWRAYLSELGAASVVYGLVTARRITGRPNYLRLDDADDELTVEAIEGWLSYGMMAMMGKGSKK